LIVVKAPGALVAMVEPLRKRETVMTDETEPKPNGLDATFAPFTAAMMSSRDQAMLAFARQCEMMSRYYAALSKAQGPEAIIAANAELAADAFVGLNELTALPAMLDSHAQEIRA